MPAPKGHEMWGNPIKPKSYTPEELWNKAVEYFEWCKENPWMKIDFKGKDADRVEIPCERPYSIEGLCVFLNISAKTFGNYSKSEGYETYFQICAHIKNIIDAQHFEGGATGAFNASIVSMKLGLQQKIDTTTNGESINTVPLTPDIITRIVDKL